LGLNLCSQGFKLFCRPPSTLPATGAVVLPILYACRKLSEFPDLSKWHKAIQGVFQLSALVYKRLNRVKIRQSIEDF